MSLASEKRKRVLPVDLEPSLLPSSFEYPLAGLQRVAITDFDSILRAHHHGVERVGAKDIRKSLMILPFEDISPAGVNQWFADGIVSEMISALTHVKALRVADTQATKDFKRYQGTLPTYAREMNIRYFVQGDVLKFGDNIKVNSRLLDIETGDHLWQDTLKGTMEDIFDIQEQVATKVVGGLDIILTREEKSKLEERGTENAEAYELYMKAWEYNTRQTKEGFQFAVQLLTEAICLDPSFARAYQVKATALAMLYRAYDRTPALLDEAEALSKEALRLKPDLFAVYGPLSLIYMHRGQLAEAEEAAREFVRKDPQNYRSHFTLGFFFGNTGQYAKAIAPCEEAVRLKPDDLAGLISLVVNCDAASERQKCAHWAAVALPYFERHLKLHPDEEDTRAWLAALLQLSDRGGEANVAAMKLTNLKDGTSLYNSACLFVKLGDRSEAIRTFRKAIEVGFKHVPHLRHVLTAEEEGVHALQGTPEYEEVKPNSGEIV